MAAVPGWQREPAASVPTPRAPEPGLVGVVSTDPALHAEVRQGLAGSRFEPVFWGQAADAVRSLTMCAPSTVCLVDAAVGEGAAEVIRQLRGAVPGLAVIVVTREPDVLEFLDLLRDGARGYLVASGLGRLGHVIEDIAAGGAAVPRSMLGPLFDVARHPDRHHTMLGGRKLSALTDREYSVLELIAAGLSTTAVAERLFIAPVTVRTHVAAVVRKLRVPDREALITLCEERDQRIHAVTG